MSRTRFIKITVKISINALIFISDFFTVGKINAINPKKNTINEIINKTVAKIVNVFIFLNLIVIALV